MIYPNTYVQVTDNTGVKKLKCIRVYNKQNKGLPGDTLLAVVRKVVPHKKLKAGDKMKVVIVLRQHYISGQQVIVEFARSITK